MAAVTLSGVEKHFGTFTALQRLDLTIADGEFLVLLGPSGCGKTTTMRIVAGLEDPSAGAIHIGERMVNDVRPKDRDVAMVFQNYGLYPHMSVEDNIGYPLKVRGVPRGDRSARIRHAAEKVELGPLLDRKPRQLSGGQRQRVALARAIVRTPQVFLMDEPLSNLDAKLRVTMRAEIKHLQNELGVTTIYVTHDQIEAMTLADRVAVMSQGRIQQLGTPEEIYDRPANLFVAGFIGSPPMNLISGQLSAGTFTAPQIDLGGLSPASSGSVVLGVRPEDITVADDADADFRGSVYAVELTGESNLVTVLLGRERVIARASRAWRGRTGETIGLRADRSRLHFFDRETGVRIGGAQEGNTSERDLQQ
ncbi:MAG: sn-glycerol-3-phosphate ABC transporter ATP-binding protein UgpC [Rhizobiaceae bacterium]|nr:MAG: sn-glycerol-3-phosphate ABC transporter ATP-binding protein UgpC [Rhizobiaceae bacterium]CAG0998079.1 sulfate transport system ATP-binding protein [Rhizobiaceae bacterium]